MFYYYFLKAINEIFEMVKFFQHSKENLKMLRSMENRH